MLTGYLNGKKTYLIAAAMFVYQILAWYLYGTPLDMMKIMEAAGLASLRAGVTKSAPAA